MGSITAGATKMGAAIRAKRKREKEALLEEEAVDRISNAVVASQELEESFKSGDQGGAGKKLEELIGSFKTTDELKTFLTTRKAFQAEKKTEIDKIGDILLQQAGIAGSKSKNLKIPDAPTSGGGLLDKADLVLESVTRGGVKAKSLSGIKSVGEAEAAIEVAKQVAGQRGKAQEKLERDYLRVNATLDRTMDSAFRFGERQLEITGTKPGELLGIIDKLTPEQFNEYKAGWMGAGREASATVGRFLIPGARGASLTSIFAKSTAAIGNTTEGNAFNVANSNGNIFSTALANNIVVPNEDGRLVKMQDLVKDSVTGKPISGLPFREKSRAINRVTSQMVSETQRHIVTQAYLRNPKLLQRRTIVKLTEAAPKFASNGDVDSAVDEGKIMPGTLYKVDGRLGVAR